ncbi:MAG: DUF1015 domain-containing protein [Actinomycetota bacterium]|nr:DUF1015 domain-containing protein [Actinomycetota bacterium]
MTDAPARGLSLAPFRALRPNVDPARLGGLLCPPYDVISESQRAQLISQDPDNTVALILPEDSGGLDRYQAAARRLEREVADGLLRIDPDPALYIYEMAGSDGTVTRGLLGAVELRDPADGVILPHENTMAGPLSDRLALMTATEANLEPIYLVYDGGGPASQLVSAADTRTPIAQTTTPDGITHRLWAVTDQAEHEAIDKDLSTRRALIADGHHRYATYREVQRQYDASRGHGAWDRGLTLLVDSTSYGPQVHAIHRVLIGVRLDDAAAAARSLLGVEAAPSVEAAMRSASDFEGFAVAITDGYRAMVLSDPSGTLARTALRDGEPAALGELDVTILHRVLVEQTWKLEDTVEAVGYAHSVSEAIEDASRTGGTAVLLRPTPVAAVAAVAAAGARMPRKSTLFTPKPASGLVMRRFADDHGS